MELKVEDVKNIQSLTVCKKFLRQSIVQNDKLNQELRHQKYKRCIAMARWCFTKSVYHFVVGRSEGGKNELAQYRISRLYSKWHERWLKLAEKFKEDK